MSPVSLLEIALENRLGRLPLPLPAPFGTLYPSTLLADDIHLLPIESHHIEPLTTFPFHHRDPFDRLIAATALIERMRLVSDDVVLDAYGVNRLW